MMYQLTSRYWMFLNMVKLYTRLFILMLLVPTSLSVPITYRVAVYVRNINLFINVHSDNI